LVLNKEVVCRIAVLVFGDPNFVAAASTADHLVVAQ
jgi:hypothetical protein